MYGEYLLEGSVAGWWMGSLQSGVLGGLRESEYLKLRDSPVPEVKML